jgi:hypothetical protein
MNNSVFEPMNYSLYDETAFWMINIEIKLIVTNWSIQ